MKTTIERLDGACVVRVSGELAGHESGLSDFVREVTDQFDAGGVVIELSEVSYVNSAGLGALIRIVSQANTQEVRVILAGARPILTGLLEVTRLDRFFESVGSEDEGLQQLRSGK